MFSLRTVSMVASLAVLQLSWGAPQANAQGWYMDVSIYSDADPDGDTSIIAYVTTVV